MDLGVSFNLMVFSKAKPVSAMSAVLRPARGLHRLPPISSGWCLCFVYHWKTENKQNRPPPPPLLLRSASPPASRATLECCSSCTFLPCPRNMVAYSPVSFSTQFLALFNPYLPSHLLTLKRTHKERRLPFERAIVGFKKKKKSFFKRL